MLESIAQSANAVTNDASYQSNTGWLYGIHLFNHGFYWEAHEVLEAVWNNAAPNSREKHLVQGVIQIANAQLKASGMYCWVLNPHKCTLRQHSAT